LAKALTRLGTFGALAIAGALLILSGFSGCASRELIPASDPAMRPSFGSLQVAEGARLAAAGNCLACHTVAGGKPYAGGAPVKTPFGIVYGTNITPDPDTGIGGWPEEAFVRAMREGIDREGRHLYPAFPYDHFTLLTDEDLGALYAYVMTRDPVRAENKPATVPIPRPLLAGWNALFLQKGPYRADASKDAQWNRGAYLVEGLAHCGACHTPRNAAGAENRREAFSGGEAEDWHAPALNAASPSPVPWTADTLHTYLRSGIAEDHALTAGPMADVVRNLSRASDEDVRAMAAYVASLDTRPAEPRTKKPQPQEAKGEAERRGKAVYAGACGDCHDRGRDAEGGALPLQLAIGLAIPTASNLAHIIHEGIVPADGEAAPWMPSYAGALTEDQLADLLDYLRAMGGKPAWTDSRSAAHKVTAKKP
jgi:mono/diheme cytochrome c family protein